MSSRLSKPPVHPELFWTAVIPAITSEQTSSGMASVTPPPKIPRELSLGTVSVSRD